MAFSSITAGVHELKLKISAENTAGKALADARNQVAALRKEAAEIPSAISAIDARIAEARAKHQKSSTLVQERNTLLQRQVDLQQELFTSTNKLTESETKYGKSAKDTQKSLEKMAITTEAMSDAANMLAKAVAAPIAAFGILAVKNASWAIEMENLFKVTTGRFEEAGQMFSKQFQEMAGVSQTRSKQMIGYLHTMMTSMGQTERAAMEMAQNLVKLGYDISSYYNIDVQTAFDKLMSGIVGLPRGLKTLGIVVTEEIIKQWALDHALIKVGETMSEQQEVYARYNVILEQTRKAQGDLLRTLTSPQNAIRILGERFYELTITLGKELLPVFKAILQSLISLTKFFQELPRPIRSGIVWLGALVAVGITATAMLFALGKSLLYVGVQLQINAVRWLTLRAAMGWVGLAAAAITAIVIAVGLLSKKTQDATAANVEYKASIEQINAALMNQSNTEEQILALQREKRRLQEEESKRLLEEDMKRVEKLTRAQRTVYEASETGLGSRTRVEPMTRGFYEQFKFEEENKRLAEEWTKQRDLMMSLKEAYGDAAEVAGTFGAIQAKVAVELAKTGKVGKIVVIGEKEGEGLIYKKGELTKLEKFIMEMYTKVREAYKSVVGTEAGPDVFADIAKLVTVQQERILDKLRLMNPAFEEAAVTVDKYKTTIEKLKESFITSAKVLDPSMFIPEMDALQAAIKATSTEEMKVLDEKTKKVKEVIKRELSFEDVVKGWGKVVYEWVEKAKPISEKFGKPISEDLIRIAEAWKKTEEGAEYLKGALKDAASEARSLGSQLQKALDLLLSMGRESQEFNLRLEESLAKGYEELSSKYAEGAAKKYSEAFKLLYGSRRGITPLEEAASQAKEKWENIKSDLTKIKKDAQEFIDKQKDSVLAFYTTMQEKWDATVRMEEMRVAAHAKANSIIKELDDAQAKGATTGQLAELYARGMTELGKIATEGDTLIQKQQKSALASVTLYTAALSMMIDDINGKLAEIPMNTANEVAKAVSEYEVLANGLIFKRGERKPTALLTGIEAIPAMLSVASESVKYFIGDVESGFAVTLTGAVEVFALALEDIRVAFDNLEKNNVEFTKSFLGSLKFLSAQTKGMLGSLLGGAISGAGSKAGGLGAIFGQILSTVKVNQKLPAGFVGPPAKVGFLENLLGGGLGSILGGALPFVGGLIGGLFGKLFHKKTAEEKEADRMKKAVEQVTKSLSKFGTISEETAKSIAKAMATMTEHAATSLYFADVIEDVGVTQKNVNALWYRSTEILTDYNRGALSAKQATESLGASFDAMLEGARALGTEGSNAMISFMEAVKASGLKVQEITDYIDEQLGVTRTGLIGAAQGLEMMATATAKGLEDLLEEKAKIEEELSDRLLRGWARRSKQHELYAVMEKITDIGRGFQDDMERIGRLTAATFNEMIANGVSLSDAFASLGPTLDMLVERYKLYGFTASGAIQELLRIREVQKANEELFNAMDGNLAVMNALYNTGGLTQELFYDSQNQMLDYYQQLRDAGLSENEAMALLVPTMERIQKIANERGYQINDETKALIEKAAVEGQLQKEQLSIVDAVLAGFGELIYALTGTVPKAFRTYMDRFKEVDAYEQRVAERRRTRASEFREGVDAYGDAVAGASSRTEDIATGWDGVTDSVREATRAVDEYNSRSVSGGGRAEEPTIYGQSGGTWQVTGASQLFRAHKGETVNIYRPATSTASAQPIASAEGSVNNNFSFQISTVDADSVEKLFKRKIIPLLQRYTKNETVLIHPNAVRRF